MKRSCFWIDWKNTIIIMLSRLTNKISHSLYNFARKRPANLSFLPLYQSQVFQTENFDELFKNEEAAHRYKQLLPTLLASQSGLYPKKFLYTSLGFDPEAEVLRVVTLRASNFHVQELSIDKVIPWSFRGYLLVTQI